MEIVKYIIKCITYYFDALAGAENNGGFVDVFVGIGLLLFMFLLYWATYSVLDNKTSFFYKTKVICSIGITALIVALIFAIFIIFC